MPRDIGGGAETDMVAKRAQPSDAPDGANLEALLEAGASIGQALRALREARSLSLAEIAQITCIRRAYLQALEEMDIDALPSRPFAVGYVKAYAQALGVSEKIAVAQFRRDAPSPEEALKAPLGVPKQRDPRLRWIAASLIVVVTAVVAWNVAQHAVAHDGAPTPPVPVTNAAPAQTLAAKGPVSLGAPMPAPADSDVPTPYVTPGMAKAVGGPTAAPPDPSVPAKQVALNPRAASYGARADKASVSLQALKAASLVIRGADGSIYFARQLSPGETFRAPANVPGLTVDVSDAHAFKVTVNGQEASPLAAAQTPISKIVAPPRG